MRNDGAAQRGSRIGAHEAIDEQRGKRRDHENGDESACSKSGQRGAEGTGSCTTRRRDLGSSVSSHAYTQ